MMYQANLAAGLDPHILVDNITSWSVNRKADADACIVWENLDLAHVK